MAGGSFTPVLKAVGRFVWSGPGYCAAYFLFMAACSAFFDGEWGIAFAFVVAAMMAVASYVERAGATEAHKVARLGFDAAVQWKAIAESRPPTIQWSDFCAAVRDNLPDDQRDAVQYAMDLAIAPSLRDTGAMH